MIPHAPILPVRVTPEASGRSTQSHGWCSWCETVHTHSAGAGHRVAHCHRRESPFVAFGYDLTPVGSAPNADAAVPAGLLVGRRRLSDTLDAATSGLRAAFERHVVGRKRIGRARISVFGRQWSIEADVTTAGPASGWTTSVGLLGLLSALYGIGRGVAGVRLLEAITGEEFDALARLTIAEAIDAAAARAAASPEDRT